MTSGEKKKKELKMQRENITQSNYTLSNLREKK